MEIIKFEDVSKRYYQKEVLKGFNLSIKEKEFAILFGEPGCGKSVILRLLTGLEKPDEGTIFVRGENIIDKPVSDLNIGYIPQSFALYPHYKIFDNIAYPLALIKTPKKEIEDSVIKSAKMLRIDHLLNKKPDQLSGGEKQRVALARGIVKKTDIFVFDDPLAGLDFKLREQLIDDLREMQKLINATFVYATSDPLETLMLAESIYVLSEGKVVDNGRLEDVFENPKHIKSIELLDFPRSNIMKGNIDKTGSELICKTDIFKFPFKIENNDYADLLNEVYIGIRPGDIVPVKNEENKNNKNVIIRCKILLKEDLGGELLLHLDSNGQKLVSIIRHEDEEFVSSEYVDFGISIDRILVFDKYTGKKIGVGGS